MISCDILMLLDNDFLSDTRVQRETKSLSNQGYKVIVLSLKSNRLEKEISVKGTTIIPFFDYRVFKLLTISYLKDTISEINTLFTFKVIHAHDHTMLNIASRIKKTHSRITLVYDSHELFYGFPMNYPENTSLLIKLKSIIVRKVEVFREKANRAYIDYLITVSDSLQNLLSKRFKINHKKTCRVRNFKNYVKEFNTNHEWLENLNVPKENTKIVFIGSNIYPNTINIESLIKQTNEVKNISIIIIAKENAYQKQIKRMCVQKNYTHVYFKSPIAYSKVSDYLSACDIGLSSIWNKKDLSYWYSLSNKLFDYLQAEIPILTTAQPEFKNIVEKHNIGVCVNPDKKNSYLKGINTLQKESVKLKKSILENKKLLSWENEEKVLLEFYNRIIINR